MPVRMPIPQQRRAGSYGGTIILEDTRYRR